ncbi:MAG: hypothetical protein J6S51_03885 [Kiritimatiellae bacterium]|nr:hypothetical protein [Kiritimatiellia bacterium]
MTKDLEMTLMELGPEYSSVVNRLIKGKINVPKKRRFGFEFIGSKILIAASVALALAIASVCLSYYSSSDNLFNTAPRAYKLAFIPSARTEIVSTQHEDGGWGSDFITRQNAAALEGSEIESERIAYRKAVRYLRLKGISPISRYELDSIARKL